MKKNIASISAIILATLLVSTGAIAHSGNYLSDSNGNKVLDGFGNCVLVNNGSNVCGKPSTLFIVKKSPSIKKHVVEKIQFAGKLFFSTNSFKLNQSGKKSLTPILRASEKLRNFKVSLYGHTDSLGKVEYNQILSENRAISIADYLVSKGVKPTAFVIFGYGESKPVATNKTKEGRSLNRRVDILFSGERTVLR
jgi:OOP family OmpA-OmpF porin